MSTYLNAATIRELGLAIQNGGGFTLTVSGGAGSLSGLSDVTLTSVQDGQFLVYNAALGRWINVGQIAVSELFISGQNKDVVAFSPGQPLARHPSGTGFILANATTLSRKSVGLCSTSTAPGFSATVQVSGGFSLADWTPIIGAASLTPLTNYFVSVTSGLLSSSGPSTPSQVAQEMGCSISPQELLIDIGPEILL